LWLPVVACVRACLRASDCVCVRAFVCMCACVCSCVCACAGAFACLCGCVCLCLYPCGSPCMCVCLRAQVVVGIVAHCCGSCRFCPGSRVKFTDVMARQSTGPLKNFGWLGALALGLTGACVACVSRYVPCVCVRVCVCVCVCVCVADGRVSAAAD
jgi:hypothetical protein